MFIKSEYDIRFQIPQSVAMLALLHVYPTLDASIRSSTGVIAKHSAEGAQTASPLPVSAYIDSFGNRVSRFVAPVGELHLAGSQIVETSDAKDPQGLGLPQIPVEDLPPETLQFLLPSRYCEVDQFVGIAQDLFGYTAPGWDRAAAIRDWVNWKVAFDYKKARPTKTAMDVFTERVGVCRDFQHLAVTLTRCMNIPARYVTGYLGDIRIPSDGVGDFSAWYQVWLDGRWWDMDARHNEPRFGRVLMAAGRDAADVAITTSFGIANLTHFFVASNEVDANGQQTTLTA